MAGTTNMKNNNYGKMALYRINSAASQGMSKAPSIRHFSYESKGRVSSKGLRYETSHQSREHS